MPAAETTAAATATQEKETLNERCSRWLATAHFPFCIYIAIIHVLAIWAITLLGQVHPLQFHPASCVPPLRASPFL